MITALVTMTSLNLPFAAIWAVCIWIIGCSTDCGEHKAMISRRCCAMCQPGEHMKEYCSDGQSTVCNPCEKGYFSDHFNIFDRCKKCQTCDQEYAEKCTPTTNAKCSCRAGYLCSNNICSTCEENKCATWETPMKTEISSGEMTKYSYWCKPTCPNNTYFDVKAKACHQFTQCSTFGLVELFRGNKTHDSVCDTNAKDSALNVILGVCFVLVSLTLLVFLYHACMKSLRKHRANINHRRVATKASDFPLSKEECGPQLIVQYESKDSSSLGHVHLGDVIV